MCIWDGSPIQPEDEREGAWEDPEDADDSWKLSEERSDDGDGWKHRFPGEEMSGPEYWLLRGMADADDDDEARRKRKRPRRNNDEDGDGA